MKYALHTEISNGADAASPQRSTDLHIEFAEHEKARSEELKELNLSVIPGTAEIQSKVVDHCQGLPIFDNQMLSTLIIQNIDANIVEQIRGIYPDIPSFADLMQHKQVSDIRLDPIQTPCGPGRASPVINAAAASASASVRHAVETVTNPTLSDN